MKKEMLINVLQPEECRIAIVEDSMLEELYVERASQESYVNNIYKGRIVNIEPSIQAAFVDFGIGRNGFLHVSDVDPVYYKHLQDARFERGDRGDRGDRGNRGGDRRDRGDRGDRGGRGGRGRGGRGRAPFEPVSIPFGGGPIPDVENYPEPPRPAPIDSETDQFGAGLELDDARERLNDYPSDERGEVREPDGEDATERINADSGDEIAAEGPSEAEAPADEAAEPRRRRSGRRKPAAEGEEGGEAKPRRRRARRKDGEATPEAAADEPVEPAASEEIPPPNGNDDKPRYMNSAEHRTTGDDEPEVSSGQGGFVFDPFAPNDRFSERTELPPAEPEPYVAHAAAQPQYPPPPDADDREPAPESEEEDTLEDLAPDMDDDVDEGDPGGRAGAAAVAATGAIVAAADRVRVGGAASAAMAATRAPKPPIQEIFKRGQEVIVQVIKEGIGTKGPTLSTYISIAGRYLVLMPSLNRLAVSRKITDEDTRVRLKDSLSELNPPKGIGFIIRTAAIDREKKELKNDLAYLIRLWEVFCKRARKVAGPVEIYRESDMITRTIRDIFTSDIDAIWVDEEQSYTQAAEFLNIVMPRYADRIKHYADTEPLFHKFKIEEEIGRIQEKKLPLPMGGSIVIEQTEALVAIDVNSGNFRADNNAEETAYQMNLQAAKEIGRQLRLRDLGGVIVNDFIDMKDEKHRRGVERALRDALRRDRARTKILKTSAFGVIEMTRQRIRPSLKRSIYMECPHCRATGSVKTAESMTIEIMRLLQLAAHRQLIRQFTATVHPDVANYLLNKKRREILQWEEKGKMQVSVVGRLGASPECLEITCSDANGSEVRFLAPEPAPRQFQPKVGGGRERDRGERDRGDRGGRGGRGRDRDRDRGERRPAERDWD